MGEKSLLENTKILLKAMVTSNPIPVTIDMLAKEYRKREGENIPCQKLGYRDLKMFLRSIPDTFIVNNHTEIVQVVQSQNSASKHVLKFVSEQKVNKNKRNLHRTGFRQDRQDRHYTKTIRPDSKQHSRPRVPRPQQYNQFNSNPKFQPVPLLAPPNTLYPSYPHSFYAADNWHANPMPNSAPNFQPGVLLGPPSLFNVPMYPNSFHAADWRNAQQNRVSATYSANVNNIQPVSKKSFASTEKKNEDKEDKVALVQALSSLNINSTDQQQQNGDSSKQNSVSDLNGDTEGSSNESPLRNIAVPYLSDDDSIFLIGTGYTSSKYGTKIPAQVIPEVLLGEDTYKIHISEVASPWKFWFHLIDEQYSLAALQNNLQSIYTASNSYILSISTRLMKIGYACVAFHNNKWMRAEFITKPLDDMVKLLFVDFGTIDDVSIENIFFLMSGLCSVPRKCYRGALHLIKPNNAYEIEKATSMFCEMVRNKPLVGIVANIDENNTVDLVIVDTSLPNEDITVNQQLTKNVFSERTPQK